jgi:hypothetical protein
MPLVPATVTVNFTSNYNGPHRVCYRVVGAPTYICTVPGSPPGAPGINPNCGIGPCSYDIDIMVDNETCDQVDYEGYVQPTCEDEVSLLARDPFVISFIPDPACNRYEVTCDDSPVGSTTINDGGTGYTNGAYNGLPSIGGGGLGATFDITVAGGIITVAAVATPGSGYTSNPVIDLTSIPHTPGTLADISVNLLGCTALTVYDCGGVTGEIYPLGTFQPGESTFMCNPGDAPTPNPDYSVAEVGNCLCSCIEQDIQETGDAGSIDYTYIACNGNVVTGSLGPLGTTGNVCMVDGSLETVVNPGATLNIAVVGACDAVP